MVRSSGQTDEVRNDQPDKANDAGKRHRGPDDERSQQDKVTLVFSSKDETHNNAVVLKDYLAMLTG